MSTLNLIHSTSAGKYNTSGGKGDVLALIKAEIAIMIGIVLEFFLNIAHTFSSFQQKTLDRAETAGDVGQRHLPKETC